MISFKDSAEKERILAALELNMNEEFRATLQYICHRITAKGLDEVLADSFKSAALDEMSHILFFSDIISKCGGTPRFTQWDIDRSDNLAGMLKADIALEQSARLRYQQQLEIMADYTELKTVVASVLHDEQEHEETFKIYLEKICMNRTGI